MSIRIFYKAKDLRLSYDKTCNLWCPTCRKKKLVVTGDERDKLIKLTDNVIIPLLKTGQSCMLNGYGDIFYSRVCRHILKNSNIDEFPNLKYKFITNAILLTPQEWDNFPGIHNMVESIRVSIDAATQETYEKVRL